MPYVSYAENARNEYRQLSVFDAIRLTDMCNALTAHGWCEEFLLKEPIKSLKEKLLLSIEGCLRNLDNNRLIKFDSIEEVRAFLSANLEDLNHSVLAALFQKALF